MDCLYPEIEPFQTEMISVDSKHTLYVERVGNPHGKPVVFLHGGPGGGISPIYRRFFNPKKWHIILFDQRGCGRSTPYASLEDNTTWDLVADIEKLRKRYGFEKWSVFGGSWGSTLALAYAQTHPSAVDALILRGIFMCRKQELSWFYQSGCHRLFPDFWEDYRDTIPEAERNDFISAYHKRLISQDDKVRMQAARAWSGWEAATSRLYPDREKIDEARADRFAEAFARIECHYFVNNAFLDRDDQLLANVDRIRHIPAWIVHGRYDVVCPIENAWDLHRAWPEAKLQVIPDAGHSATEPAIARALVEATDQACL